jgi:hypothetical protein
VLTTALLVILILGLGTHLSDGVRLRQEEAILRKLTVPEAHAYYEVLRRRATRVRILRAVTVASLGLSLMAARRRFFPPPPAAPLADGRPALRPSNTEAARALADGALAAYAARQGLDPRKYPLHGVTGDDRHPWIFEFRVEGGGGDPIRVYVDKDGRTEVHRVQK